MHNASTDMLRRREDSYTSAPTVIRCAPFRPSRGFPWIVPRGPPVPPSPHASARGTHCTRLVRHLPWVSRLLLLRPVASPVPMVTSHAPKPQPRPERLPNLFVMGKQAHPWGATRATAQGKENIRTVSPPCLFALRVPTADTQGSHQVLGKATAKEFRRARCQRHISSRLPPMIASADV